MISKPCSRQKTTHFNFIRTKNIPKNLSDKFLYLWGRKTYFYFIWYNCYRKSEIVEDTLNMEKARKHDWEIREKEMGYVCLWVLKVIQWYSWQQKLKILCCSCLFNLWCPIIFFQIKHEIIFFCSLLSHNF